MDYVYKLPHTNNAGFVRNLHKKSAKERAYRWAGTKKKDRVILSEEEIDAILRKHGLI